MGELPKYDACLPCKMLYKPEQVPDGRCTKCGGPLRPAPEKVVRAKQRARKKRAREAARKRQIPTATRKDETLPRGGRGRTQKVEIPTIGPVKAQRDLGSAEDLDALPDHAAPHDELLEALETANLKEIEEDPKPRREQGSKRRRTTGVGGGSLFIPLDSFSEPERNEVAEAPENEAPQLTAADLFGDSATIGDSGITAQTAQARRGQVGVLEEAVSFGDYELREVLGRGGMGVVYRAYQRSLGREVALKLMSAQNIADEDRIRFQREARAAARHHHPNIVPIFDIGSQGGHDYFTLELIEGTTLHRLAMNREVTVEQSLVIMKKIAQAIDYAHSKGVIHRDLKPQNILIDPDGEPHVTDFGLAKDLQDAINLTTPGIALGSPPYMPPEQAMGNYEQVDAVSDVYGLGAIFYECLAARPPFIGETAYEIIARVQSEEPLEPSVFSPEVPKDAEIICLKAIDKVKGARYPSAKAMAKDLDRLIRGEPILARPPSFTVKMARRIVKHRTQVASLSLALATVIASAIFIRSVFVNEGFNDLRPTRKFEQITTNQQGAPIDRALGACSEGRLGDGLKQVAGAMNGKAVAKESWLSDARSELGTENFPGVAPLLKRSLDIAETSSGNSELRAEELIGGFTKVFNELRLEQHSVFIKGCDRLLSDFVKASFPTPLTPPGKLSLLQRIQRIPLLSKRQSIGNRRGDAELARAVTVAMLRALSAQLHRQRGKVEPARRLMMDLITSQAPDVAMLALARLALVQEGGANQEAGQAMIRELRRKLKGHPLEAIATTLEQRMPRPRTDTRLGQVLAQKADFKERRWTFPAGPLSLEALNKTLRKAEPELFNDAKASITEARGAIAELYRLGPAAYPSNAIPSLDGQRYAIAWLGAVYTLDSAEGRILRRTRLPARAFALRSFGKGLLVASTARAAGQDGLGTRLDEYLIDPESGSVRLLLPGLGGAHIALNKQASLSFETALRRQLEIEAELWLNFEAVRWLEKRVLRSRGKAAVKAGKKRLREAGERRLRASDQLVSMDSRQPWLHLLRGDLAAKLGKPADARKAFDDAALATIEGCGESIDPLEAVEVAARLASHEQMTQVPEILKRAFSQLLEHYRYEPRLAGFGQHDPGVVLTRVLDTFMERSKRAKPQRRSELFQHYKVVEGWRDTFAPALAASDDALRSQQRHFGTTLPPQGLSPAPLPPDANERLPRGFAGMGMGTVVMLHMLLYSSTVFLIFFGLFVVSLTFLRIYRQQREDLALIGYESWVAGVKAWFQKPLLRLQYSFPTYLTLRDRLGFSMILTVFLVALSLHDTIVRSFDTRQLAPRAFYAGFGGHPAVLEYLLARSEGELTADPKRATLLAYSLSQIGEAALASELYQQLARLQPDPNAFNACILRDVPKARSPEQQGQLASKLDALLSSQVPERHWARWILTRQRSAREAAYELAPHTFSKLDRYGPASPVIVAPPRALRDEVVLGRPLWWTAWPGTFLQLFVPLERASELVDACKRVLNQQVASEQSNEVVLALVSWRTSAFFLLPNVLLIILASMLLPTRHLDRPESEDESEGGLDLSKLEFVFPGVPQLMRGYTPSGVLFGTLLVFLVLFLENSGNVKGLNFKHYTWLVGEASSTASAVLFRVKMTLFLVLAGLYGLHWMHLSRLRRRDEERALFLRSSRAAPTRQPAPTDS